MCQIWHIGQVKVNQNGQTITDSIAENDAHSNLIEKVQIVGVMTA